MRELPETPRPWLRPRAVRHAGTGALALVALLSLAAPAAGQEARPLELQKRPPGVHSVWLEPTPEGGHAYQVRWRDGRRETLTPDELAELLYTGHPRRSRFFKLLNITSPIGVAWVALGLLGQVLFTGRMLVQWITSERRRRSVVPIAFWWMSLAGASLLVVYFVWRKDIIGVLGQTAGWIVYARNLRLIHRSRGVELRAPLG